MPLKNYKKTVPISDDVNYELDKISKELKISKYKLVENFLVEKIRELRNIEEGLE